MPGFVDDTALEPLGPGRYRARLSEAWRLWGPAGGYVSAIALRAAGAATNFARPVSFSCQYLRVGGFDDVELSVESLRAGRRSEALRVEMTQEGRAILTAQVWAADGHEAMVHDHVPVPEIPDPETLEPMEKLMPDRKPFGPFAHFEQRPANWLPEGDHAPSDPELRGFFRFRPVERHDDAFVDAARALVLLDTFTWPATYRAHPSPEASPWIAPNLDLYVRFHRDTRPHPWLFSVGRADLAENGWIAAQGQLWSPDRKLLATAATQLFCSRRPEQFR